MWFKETWNNVTLEAFNAYINIYFYKHTHKYLVISHSITHVCYKYYWAPTKLKKKGVWCWNIKRKTRQWELGFKECMAYNWGMAQTQQSPTFLVPGSGFMEDNFSMDQWAGVCVWAPVLGKWLPDGSSVLHLLYTLFLLLLHQFHLRSSGITSRRLGTPDIDNGV